MAEQAELLQPIDTKKMPDTIDLFKDSLDDSKNKTEYEKFFIMLNEVQAEYFAKEKPYDYRAAKQDYEEQIEKIFKSNPRKYGNSSRNVKLEAFPFHEYGKSDRFKLVGRKPIIEKKLLDGIKQDVQTGWFAEYIGTKMRMRVSVTEKLKPEKK